MVFSQRSLTLNDKVGRENQCGCSTGWKCKRSTPPQRRASFKDIQADSDVLCATASEHD